MSKYGYFISSMNYGTSPNIHLVDEASWKAAKARHPHIHYLYGLEKRTAKDVKEAADKLNLCPAQVYNLLHAYQQNPVLSSLLPKQRGWTKGKTRLSKKQQDIIKDVIEDEYYQQERRNVNDIKVEVDRRCRSSNTKKPSIKAIQGVIDKLDIKKVISAREGYQQAHQLYDPVRESLVVNKPLQLVQIDHTLVDLEILDDARLESLGRPWITLAIDVFSRMVLAFYLSLYRPSTVSVAAAISQMLLPKYHWLNARNLSVDWPARGIPEFIAMDNAKEFKSIALERACSEYAIEPLYRRVKRPKVLGAHIERLIGTMMGAVHLLPGTTFSNIQQKGDYKSSAKATLTFEEAEKWIALEILGKYHQRKHKGIGVSPISRWQENFDPAIDYRLEGLDQEKLFVDFLPHVTRKVGSMGIVFNNIYYWEDVLTTWLTRENRKALVKYNPRDLSKIFLVEPNSAVHTIRYRDLTHPPITLSELLHANEKARIKGIDSVDEAIIFDTISEQRQLVAIAKKKTRSAKRAEKRRQQGFDESAQLIHDKQPERKQFRQLREKEEKSWEGPAEYTSEEWP